jgi:hypothetical protein
MASCELGAEAIADDAGSDLYAGTVSQAAAVSMATLDSKHAGLGPARVLTRPLRGLLLVVYALIAGSTRFGRAAQAAVALALAAGGALLAIALLQEEIPSVGGDAGRCARPRRRRDVGAAVTGVAVRCRARTPGPRRPRVPADHHRREQIALHAPTLWTVGGLTWRRSCSAASGNRICRPGRSTGSPPDRRAGSSSSVWSPSWRSSCGSCNDVGGWWILRLEFAGTVANTAATLDDAVALADVRWAILTDLLLIVAYAVTLVAWAVLALRHVATLPLTRWRLLGWSLPRPAPVGASQLLTIAAWAGLSAAVLDVVENLALLRMIAAYEEHGAALEGALSPVVPAIAWIAAALKFTLILAVIIGGAVGLLLRADPPSDGP